MDYKNQIAQLLTNLDLQKDIVLPLLTDTDIKNGDFALPCFKIAASLKQNPVQFSADLSNKINDQIALNSNHFLSKTEGKGGYLNFFLNRNPFIAATLSDLISKGEDFAPFPPNGKTVCIDYSSINIAKDFHIGHLLTTVIGGSLYKIFKFLGFKTIGINHLGDWGTQFGKLICAVKMWGDEKSIAKADMKELTRLYVKFHDEAEKDVLLEQKAREWFKKIESGDKEALDLFENFKKITLKEISKIYCLLGIEFDSYDGESFFNDKMTPIVDELKDKGLLSISDGAFVVELGEGQAPCLILKSDGASLYATRDLAAAVYRKNTYNFDKNLYVVAYQQNLHFKQVFAVLEKMGKEWAKDCVHVAFGMVSLEGSGALSTRKGNVVLLKDVLNASIEKTKLLMKDRDIEAEKVDKIALDVGVGAVVFSALYNQRIKDMVFSFDKALNFDGETAPYLQYTHARCCSVLKKAEDGLNSDDEGGGEKVDNRVDSNSNSNDNKTQKQRADSHPPANIASVLMNNDGLSGNKCECGGGISSEGKGIKIENGGTQKQRADLPPPANIASVLSDDTHYQVIRLLAKFDETVLAAANAYEPSILARYLIDLAQSYNKFYIENRILGAEKTTKQARLILTACVKVVLKNGMKLLLINAPDKM